MLEKLLYPAATTALYLQRRLDAASWYISLVDCLFLVLFAVSYWKTGKTER